MNEHDWEQILQRVASGSTDTVEICRRCGAVKHSYLYATLTRQLATERWWSSFGKKANAHPCLEPPT